MKGFGHWGEASTAAWLHLRNEGGWWSIDEIKQELKEFSRAELRKALKNLANRHHLSQQNLTSKIVYGVTHSCIPIPGYSLTP